MKLSVIGTGYLGAVHAACMAELGFDVVGIDVDEARIETLNSGKAPFFEPDFEPILTRSLESGRLHFTTDFAAIADADVHFICVGTPQIAGGLAADTSYVDAATHQIAKYAKAGAVVAGKSTVPVGTAERLQQILDNESPHKIELAWNPEFLREGFAIKDTLHPDRIVIGVRGEAAEPKLRTVYASMLNEGIPFLVTDFATAELVKVAANAFLATKISFINAMAEVCETVGGDVVALADAIGHDARIGRRFLNAGIGFGGGCLPKDIRAFQARAAELGVQEAVEFLRDVDEVNTRRRTRVVKLAGELLGGNVAGSRVAVLGAAFKPNSDDVRDSPALDIANAISKLGAEVVIFDPEAMPNALKRFPDLLTADSAEAAIMNSDIVLHLTEWDEFKEIDPIQAASWARNTIMVDGRNNLDLVAWRKAGWTAKALGRP
jgi:UDPglucose 6-dehydrogenase